MSLIEDLPEDATPLIDIIERIMTQHWHLGACTCWICQEGRALGCRPREQFLGHRHPGESRPSVKVDYIHEL